MIRPPFARPAGFDPTDLVELRPPGVRAPGDALDGHPHRAVDRIVNHHVIKRPAALGHPDFALRSAIAFFRSPLQYPGHVREACCSREASSGRHDENHQRIGILKPNLQRALHVDLQQHIFTVGQVIQRGAFGCSIVFVKYLRVFQKLTKLQLF